MYPPPPVKLMGFWAALLICLCALTPAAAQVPPIIGDVDDDGFVGIADINLIQGYWNQNVPPADPRADPSGDGFVGIEDLNYVLGNWNAGHPPLQPFKGMNLHQVRYWSREWPFVDIMKIADPWRVQSGESGLVTDANDWPTVLPPSGVTTYMYTGNNGTYPTGRYVCTYDGVGTLVFGDDANVVSNTPGRIEFDVDNAVLGISLKITSTSPSPNHARNIKIWMPGFEGATSPFHPLFVKRLRPFSVIRFMDWQRTNDLDVVTWNSQTTDRATLTYRTQGTGKGVALEYMIELCNELGASPWFCMPHKADATYVTNFATMVRDGDPANNVPPLHDRAKIYVEWSNEVWNDFNVGDWLTGDVIQGGLGLAINSNAYFDRWADEAAEDFAIWRDVFAGQEHRIIRVAAGQQANSWVTWKLAERLRTRPSNEQFDAISCAAYFGKQPDKLVGIFDATTTGQDVVDYSLDVIIPNESAVWYEDHGHNPPAPGDEAWKHLAYRYSDPNSTAYMGRNISLLAYGSGQHWTSQGVSRPYTQALYEAQSLDADAVLGTRGIYDAYIANMTAFKQAGGELYMSFNYVSKQNDLNGSWGHLRSQDQPIQDAHKMRAVLEFDPNTTTLQSHVATDEHGLARIGKTRSHRIGDDA